ncbi:hypothetical protein QYM36_012294 [Artemia franciscana]|uniref:Uncharacterized protein n=1 Tax=Artemia franciscana TaxID=6661 RepID=A0AA88L3A5_ARTSF|nr:hypothetical protein QYM36_012294 [Artemia franciscana]
MNNPARFWNLKTDDVTTSSAGKITDGLTTGYVATTISNVTNCESDPPAPPFTFKTTLATGTLNARTPDKEGKKDVLVQEINRGRIYSFEESKEITYLSKRRISRSDFSRSNEDPEEFYSQLHSLTSSIKKNDIILVTGDFSAVVGSNSDDNEDVMEKFEHGTRNRRGEWLMEYCRDNELAMANTLFKNRKRRKVTWRSPD